MTRTIIAVGFAGLTTVVAGTALAQDEPAAKTPDEPAAKTQVEPAAKTQVESTAKTTVTPPAASAAVSTNAASTSGGGGGGAFTARKVSVGLLAGYAFSDFYGVGMGLRGGYTLPMSVYVGGTFVYQIGGKIKGVDVSLMYFGAEAGYDLAAGPLVLRPVLGLGLATVSATTPGYTNAGFTVAEVSASDTKFSFWPGVAVLYPISNFYVGLDLRYNFVLGYDASDAMRDNKPNAFGALLDFGMTF